VESLKTDKRQVENLRKLLQEDKLDAKTLESFIDSYEELIELTEASIEMIDHLVQKMHISRPV